MVYGVVWWFSGGGYGNLDNACYVTHEARPMDIIAPSTTSTIMSSGSVPIATSTPVNLASGPVSPPPLSLGITQTVPHQEQNALGGGVIGKSATTTTTTTTTGTSYPAVLKGRSGASPPNPNLVPSGKVPPPVPPRGSGARSARSPGPTTTSSSSITSSRGDEAALITSRQYRLHDSSTILHHRPLPYNTSTSTSTTTTTTTTTFDTPTTIFNTTTITTITTTTTTTTVTTTIGTKEYPTMSAAIFDELHAHASTPAFLPPCHENLPHIDDIIRNRGIIVEEPIEQQDNEEEEFVSIEKVDDCYYIKTSPYPFRPERRKYKSTIDVTTKPTMSYPIEELSKPIKMIDHMAKFTYFINPASRDDLMNYKMSRKDKKHSETYHERMKRKQMEIDVSINDTVTGINQNNLLNIKSDGKSRSWKMFHSSETKFPKDSTDQYPSLPPPPPPAVHPKILEVKKENRLLRKIKEKSMKRKKRLAPVPNSKRQYDRDYDEAGQKRIMREIEKVSLKRDPSSSSYVDGTASCDNVSIDIQNYDTNTTTSSYQRSRYYNQVDHRRLENIRKDHQRDKKILYDPIASTSSKEPSPPTQPPPPSPQSSNNFITKFTRKESKMIKPKSGLDKMTSFLRLVVTLRDNIYETNPTN
ncbi:hypothetical protein M0802_015408 [Mischocyttarus mexicanus]|nr:hypothetical protein M0802_015408 [Mischocyttarus mexicanus]